MTVMNSLQSMRDEYDVMWVREWMIVNERDEWMIEWECDVERWISVWEWLNDWPQMREQQNENVQLNDDSKNNTITFTTYLNNQKTVITHDLSFS